MSTRLIPPITRLTQPYWDAASRHELVIQQCPACSDYQFPPRAHCGACGAGDLNWREASGKGTVYTYTVAHRAPHPVFTDQCPLVVAVVELEEGPRLISNIVNCDPNDVKVGLAVVVAFDPVDDSDILLPVFKPSG